MRCSKPPAVLGLCLRHAKEEADRLCREAVLARDRRCTRCGSTEALQWSHHITRARLWVRWDRRNSTIHCAGCHKTLTEHPLLHREVIVSLIGEDGLAALMEAAYGPVGQDGRRTPPGPFRRSDLADVLERLRREAAA